MHCIVTAGPTYEPVDEVRRLTNFSTGRLGVELSNHLTSVGYAVTLLLGEQATYCGERRAGRVERFTTVQDLRDRLEAHCAGDVGAVFHAAAVGDFLCGRVLREGEAGELMEVGEGKIRSRGGKLFVELVPAPKLISAMRGWFPRAFLAGWKYEVDGDRVAAVAMAARQVQENRTDLAVVNGKAYGEGFGLVDSNGGCRHVDGLPDLFARLAELAG